MWLTRGVDYGLIRPVARIAQSVEQGIENPRVLGSIPSPGTTIQRTRPKGGFLHFCSRTLHRTTFDYSPPAAHPFGAGATSAPFNAFGVSPSRAPLFKEPAQKAGFCISVAGLSIELRSIIRRQRLTPSGPARQARRSTPSALVRAGHHYLKNPPKRRVFAFLQPDSPSN